MNKTTGGEKIRVKQEKLQIDLLVAMATCTAVI
jgi:hypothetical protein